MSSDVVRPIRVMVVDDDLMVRETLADYLSVADDMELVAECADGAEAVERVEQVAPDVVLMDIRMPELDGVSAARKIVTAHPGVRVVMLTTFDDDEVITDAFEAGASGYLLKNTRSAALVQAVRAAWAGLSVVPPGLVSRWSPAPPMANRPRLLPREREVLVLVTQGMTNAEIAKHLFVSTSTVKLHVAALTRKLGAENRTNLAARALALGVVLGERRGER